MNIKIRYGFTLLLTFFSYFLLALFAPFRQPIKQVRQRVAYVRQPRRRMAIFMAAFALLLLFCLFAMPVFAQDSFGVTNNLVSGTQYTLYPTNKSGIGTGTGVELAKGYKTVGISVAGDVINSNSAPIGLTLARSDILSPSSYTNWETTPLQKLIITVPAMTNHFLWTTNFPDDFIGAGLEMGVYQLTNNFTTGCSISNLVVKPIKKFSTINYP